MLIKRVLSALVLIPLVVLAAYQGGLWLAGLVALFAALAVIEFYQLSNRLGARPSIWVGTALTVGLVVAAQLRAYRIGAPLFIGVLGALMVERVWRQNFDGFLSDWATTLVGSAYIGGMLSHFVLLRGLQQGLVWVALAILVTWVTDTGAYFVGTTVGRRRFFPRISPRKTLEGAIGGLLLGTPTAMAIAIPLLHLPWPQAAALGVLIALAATFGDLAESLIKRQAGVKDSGTLLAAHGGVLDRIDSICNQSAADERSRKYRHAIATERPIDKYLMLNVNARK